MSRKFYCHFESTFCAALAMASIHNLNPCITGQQRMTTKCTAKQQNVEMSWPPPPPPPPPSISRRSAAILMSLLPLNLVLPALPLLARESRKRKIVPLEDYLSTSNGLKYFDIVEGKGPVAEKGMIVQVHFDCIYRGVTALSSRESKLLAGNRIIAQSYEFQIGATPGKERKREFSENANGLFSAQAAPKPPRAMYTITEGMKVGGKRTVIVPPEAGYGPKGMNEIPAGATFDLNIELLEVRQPERN